MGWGSTSNVTDYGDCSQYFYSGPEVAYRFNAPFDTGVDVRLSLEQASTDIMILDQYCSPASCMAYGLDSVHFEAQAGVDYSVVVDGWSGAVGTYLIEFDCVSETEVICDDGIDNDGDGLPDCHDEDDCSTDPACPKCHATEVIACGDTDVWSNNGEGSTDAVVNYNCAASEYGGPEYAYTFEAPSSGTVTVSLSDEEAATDLMVLANEGWGCSPVHCLAYGPQDVSFEVVKNEKYFFVVDGHGHKPEGVSDFSSGAYTITVDCSQL